MGQQTDAFFQPDGDGWRATQWTRGPWSAQHQHAGPPAALLARAIERLLADGSGFEIRRLTYEILRPVPIDWLQVRTHVLRAGRKVQWLGATLATADGTEVMRAAAVCVRVQAKPVPRVEHATGVHFPTIEASEPFSFPFFASGTSYSRAMESRLADGVFGSGAATVWMRMRLPLVLGERPSAVQRAACAADSGSGVSKALDTARYSFVNPDLSIYFMRALEGEWIALDARTQIQPDGAGLCETALFDQRGYIGCAQQSLVVEALGR